MHLQRPHAVGTSPARGISQSHIASPAGNIRGWETPATSSTATATTQGNFTTQFHASSHKTLNTLPDPPAIRVPYSVVGCKSEPLPGQEEKRTFPGAGAKMRIVLLLMDFLITREEILSGVRSCVKHRTRSLIWV